MGNSNGKPVVFTDQVNLNHFRLLRVVGKGAFGKVRIVERKDTNCTFALKYIRKDEVVRSESVRNIIRERRMLEHLNHPFLCNLRYSFQDIEYLYLVVDLMTGGDLRFHIARKSFTEEAVRFWIAELGCALRYIHGQGIVHRDVKPDNVLLDHEGHVHLADFNVASDFKPEKPLTSRSGTLAYLAPDVYEGKGYSCEVDWWSLGVVFYECIYNKRPFEAHTHDQLAQKVLKGEPSFPRTNPPVSNPCLHAISSLLEKDRTQRIGAAGFETFSDNPFFRELDFVALEKKEIDPIFVPSSEKTNFDATYDLEELLLEEAPLEARARRQKPREQLKDDATTAEIRADELHRMIEKLFEPFDYTMAQFDRPISSKPTEGNATPPTEPFKKTRAAPIPTATAPRTPASEDGSQAVPTRSRSSTTSPAGSPPLPVDFPYSKEAPRSVPKEYFPEGSLQREKAVESRSPSKSRRGLSRSKKTTPTASAATVSSDGPIEPVDMASVAIGSPSGSDEREKRPSGILGFMSRKKGRERSPKARERGVLGKEGARVILNS